jgi:hypothetical protein
MLNSESKARIIIPICAITSVMRRIIKAAAAPGEFKCRTCEILWSSFMENNIPCIDRSIRSGLHNFDFSKPIALEKSQPDLF